MKTRKVTFTLLMVVGFMILFMTCSPEAEAAGKLKTITVTKINPKTAKKVHKQLMQGKAFKIRFKGNEKRFYKQFEKLGQKVSNCTNEGFDVFPICMRHTHYCGVSGSRNPKKSGQYTIFNVTKSDCQEYIYGIKFAKSQYKDFKAYVNKALGESERIYNGLLNNTIIPAEGRNNRDELISTTKVTIASLKDLKDYLAKTKFRNLSESMKARILLEFGYIHSRLWGECSMHYNEEGNSRLDTYKALYQRKAYGRSSAYATVACKICATFHIGKFDFLSGKLYGSLCSVTRTKVKTTSGKTRYVIVNNGVFESYNTFVGFKDLNLPGQYKKDSHKVGKPIKKINMKTQQLIPIGLSRRGNDVYDTLNGNNLATYHLDVPKSEW